MILLIGQGLNSYAQNILFEGVVMDGNTNELLPIAFVRLVKPNDTSYLESDFSDTFAFPNLSPGFYSINIRANAYMPIDTLIYLEKASKRIFKLFPDTTVYEIYVSDNNSKGAIADIEKGTIELFLRSGIIGVNISSIDTIFESKYKVKYKSLGCISLHGDNLNEYNQTIFAYLDKKYGKKWREEIRRDVIGLSE